MHEKNMKVLFVNINENLPEEYNDKYKGCVVLDKSNNLYIGTNTGWKEITNSDFDEFKEYINGELPNLITREEFDSVKIKSDNSIVSGDLKTINNESLVGNGDITIDLSLFKLVTELPTENIKDNKIYLLLDNKGIESNNYKEYIYANNSWEMLGEYKAEVDLSGYLKTDDAEKKYMKLSNGSGSVSVNNSTGSMTNYGNSGQAFNAVRDCGENSITGKPINAAAFGVKLDGTTAFSHKVYNTFNASTGSYTGAKNTAVLTFSGESGLRYAKNTGAAADVTDAMYKYVGVIDSPDENQRVYSKTQVDTLISKMKTILERLGATTEELNSITI